MKIYNIKPEDYKIKIVMKGENMKLPTSIENRLNENIVEKARNNMLTKLFVSIQIMTHSRNQIFTFQNYTDLFLK